MGYLGIRTQFNQLKPKNWMANQSLEGGGEGKEEREGEGEMAMACLSEVSRESKLAHVRE